MNNHEDIFRQRFLPLYRQLYAAAFALLGNPDDAADAVQDTMVKIWNIRNSFNAIASPQGYAMQLLKTSAIDIIRRRRFTAISDAITEPEAEVAPEADSVEFLKKAIASLPDRQQEVIRLSALAGLNTDEITATMGISAENARQLLSRARRKLRELYQKNI